MRPSYCATVDSSICILESVARYLRGEDFPALGQPRALEYVIPAFNLLPAGVREYLYTRAARWAGVEQDELDDVRADDIAKWAAGQYRLERRHAAVLLGSPNGAAAHLAAALDAPLLTQTFLIPVLQHAGGVDDVVERAEGAMDAARRMLVRNPGLQVHQLHDPVNDRPQLRCIDYFRVKLLRLEPSYVRFIEDALEPGGTIVIVDCRHARPTTLLQERHVFQMGGLGGVSLDEYFEGGERVRAFLERYGSRRRRWEAPEPDADRPESEWGYEPSWNEEIERLARRRGYRVVRLAFDHPEDLSPTVADLYRWWYRARSLPDRRLVAECFCLLEPWWTLRTGSAPYWMAFNAGESIRNVHVYLDGTEPFDEIGLMLLSNAVHAIGSASIEDCRDLLARAGRRGRFVGTNPDKYPLDIGALTRYRRGMERFTSQRFPLPGPLSLDQVERFVAERGDPRVRWSVEMLGDRSAPATR